MNTDTGQIVNLTYDEYTELQRAGRAGKLKPMVVPPTTAQLKRSRVGRNEPCPCGSGVKFKRCCYTGGNGR